MLKEEEAEEEEEIYNDGRNELCLITFQIYEEPLQGGEADEKGEMQ